MTNEGRRYLVVALLAAASLITWLPDITRDFGHPLGRAGYSMDYSGKVMSVTRSARAAGIRTGDQIDLAGMNFHDRVRAITAETAQPGMPVTAAFTSPRGSYVSHLVSEPEDPNVPVIILRQFTSLLMLGFGIFLVLRKPSAATWAFYLFALNGGAPENNLYLLGPDWLNAAGFYYYELFSALFYFALIFAVYLLHEGPLSEWRRRVLAASYLFIVISASVSIAVVTSWIFAGYIWAAGWVLQTVLSTLIPLYAATAVLFATYFVSNAIVRERLRWVLWAFCIGSIAITIDGLGSQGNLGIITMTYFQHSLLIIGYTLLIAIPVTYAILKHRIIDVNVAISRALVYTVLSAMVVGAFALVDLFFSTALSEGRVGMIANVALALVIGFFFNSLHGRVDGAIDALLFRSRHLAERHIETVIKAIPYAESQAHVNRLLVEEPVRAFALATGVLTRIAPDAIFPPAVRDPESLISYVKGERKAIRFGEHDIAGHAAGMHFAVAVPVFSDADLEAIAFYGPHSNGTDIDNDELLLLERLALAAGTAYVRLKAAALTEEVAGLRLELARFSPASS